jgi:hypothetical protein
MFGSARYEPAYRDEPAARPYLMCAGRLAVPRCARGQCGPALNTERQAVRLLNASRSTFNASTSEIAATGRQLLDADQVRVVRLVGPLPALQPIHVQIVHHGDPFVVGSPA